MKKITLTLSGILLSSLISHSALALDAKSVAAVNGKKISQKTYQQHLKAMQARNPNSKAPVNRQAVLDELINREVLLQAAKKKKLDKTKEFKNMVNQYKQNLLIQTLLSKSDVAKPITDKELKKVYDAQIGQADTKEYKARHILVKSESKAREIIKKLNDGAEFSELAKKESTGPSGKQGGDLGWFTASRMVPEFAKAVAKLKKGTITQKPVKTQFGYHVIKLEDSRTRELPKFEDVKEQIRPLIQRQRLAEYVMKLRSKAKIEIK